MTWDAETEQRVAQALAVVRGQRRLHIVDHHPWEAPANPPNRLRRFTWNLRRYFVRALAVTTTLELARRGAESGGWLRLLAVGAAAVVVLITLRQGRRPG